MDERNDEQPERPPLTDQAKALLVAHTLHAIDLVASGRWDTAGARQDDIHVYIKRRAAGR